MPNLVLRIKANVRKLYHLFHPSVLKTCQLLMGVTVLEPNSIWNTIHAIHMTGRLVYFYFDRPRIPGVSPDGERRRPEYCGQE